MNEIDLKLKIEGLEKVIKEQQESADQYKVQLADTKKQLEDYNKPELTPAQLDAIQCESHEFINGADLVQELVDKVCNLFKEADAPEEETTTDNS